MSTIDKYLFEKSITPDAKSLKSLILSPKSAKYKMNDVDVTTTLAGDTLIFEYPSKEGIITYNLIQACDSAGKKYTQIGLRSAKNMKFIIDL